MTGLATYAVLSHLTMGGRAYEPGTTVELEPDVAAPLLSDGVLSDGDPGRSAGQEGATAPILDRAVAALRTAGGDEVREFFRRISDEPEIRAKLEEQMDRHAALIAALDGFDADDAALWTRSGKPKTDALESATGLAEVSASERDAAWESCRKARDPAAES